MNAMLDFPRFTPEDLLKMPDGDHYELVNGRLVETEMAYASCVVATEMAYQLRRFLEQSPLGIVSNADTTFQCYPFDPGMVRKPDVSFIRWGRLPAGQVNRGHVRIAPDLAVEVTSPNDLFREVEGKIDEYLRAGVKLIWLVHPELRWIRVHRPDGTITQLREPDELTGEDLLPGFRCRIGDLFAVLNRLESAESEPEA